ncbi:hypothetical protein BpHYR1_011966 [Brachionus plicatilis]|uniref:Uncharacterized protein n=1 Tax=Brachionus plicatilis TaxID=10195 RepID=A0A3M7RZY0_BRAPC|nr:hypothetical protein BpHYR1_011966 [Brachionus plicatilis]
MKASVQCVFLVALVAAFAINESMAFPKLSKEIRKQVFLEELGEFEKDLDQKILEMMTHSRVNKRSDVDARLMEIQAKILLKKMFQESLPGHGRFDFDQIGKRSNDQVESNEDSIAQSKLIEYFHI